MSDSLEALKTELERLGAANDGATAERSRRMLNITRDTGEFLSVLVRATLARRVLEIGTSNGYSTLWLAEAARAIGRRSDHRRVLRVQGGPRLGELRAFRARAATSRWFTMTRRVCFSSSEDSAFDFVFLDSERSEYPGWWPELRRVLRPGGLLVVDNAISHVAQLAPFIALVNADPQFATSLVPVGNGEFLALKAFS